MSTARQTVSPQFFNEGTFTGPAPRANVDNSGLDPATSPQFWWGVAPGSQLGPGNTPIGQVNGSPAAPAPSSPSSPSSSDGGCC